ncbi:twin-arginine translocation signal domain-containing protein [bacterium]|nr:twin-arginine translocation signal domain-containing protein [bacterium]
MATRRNFFKYLGIAGGVAGGGVVAVAAMLPKDKPKHIEQLDGGSHLQLQATYGEPLRLGTTTPTNKLSVFSQGPEYVPGTAKQVDVSFKPGPDGELYLKVNGKWRKVVTE